MDSDYQRYYRTLQRRHRRDGDPYRQYCVSAGLPLDAVEVAAAWNGDDRRHPLISVSGYRLADTARSNSYTSEVSSVQLSDF